MTWPRWPKVELWHADNDLWYFHVKAGNGQITSSSQGYKQKRYAKEAIKRDHPNRKIIEIEREE